MNNPYQMSQGYYNNGSSYPPQQQYGGYNYNAGYGRSSSQWSGYGGRSYPPSLPSAHYPHPNPPAPHPLPTPPAPHPLPTPPAPLPTMAQPQTAQSTGPRSLAGSTHSSHSSTQPERSKSKTPDLGVVTIELSDEEDAAATAPPAHPPSKNPPPVPAKKRKTADLPAKNAPPPPPVIEPPPPKSPQTRGERLFHEYGPMPEPAEETICWDQLDRLDASGSEEESASAPKSRTIVPKAKPKKKKAVKSVKLPGKNMAPPTKVTSSLTPKPMSSMGQPKRMLPPNTLTANLKSTSSQHKLPIPNLKPTSSNQKPSTSHQKPSASNQKSSASNQKSSAPNQKPTTSNPNPIQNIKRRPSPHVTTTAQKLISTAKVISGAPAKSNTPTIPHKQPLGQNTHKPQSRDRSSEKPRSRDASSENTAKAPSRDRSAETQKVTSAPQPKPTSAEPKLIPKRPPPIPKCKTLDQEEEEEEEETKPARIAPGNPASGVLQQLRSALRELKSKPAAPKPVPLPPVNNAKVMMKKKKKKLVPKGQPLIASSSGTQTPQTQPSRPDVKSEVPSQVLPTPISKPSTSTVPKAPPAKAAVEKEPALPTSQMRIPHESVTVAAPKQSSTEDTPVTAAKSPSPDPLESCDLGALVQESSDSVTTPADPATNREESDSEPVNAIAAPEIPSASIGCLTKPSTSEAPVTTAPSTPISSAAQEESGSDAGKCVLCPVTSTLRCHEFGEQYEHAMRHKSEAGGTGSDSRWMNDCFPAGPSPAPKPVSEPRPPKEPVPPSALQALLSNLDKGVPTNLDSLKSAMKDSLPKATESAPDSAPKGGASADPMGKGLYMPRWMKTKQDREEKAGKPYLRKLNFSGKEPPSRWDMERLRQSRIFSQRPPNPPQTPSNRLTSQQTLDEWRRRNALRPVDKNQAPMTAMALNRFGPAPSYNRPLPSYVRSLPTLWLSGQEGFQKPRPGTATVTVTKTVTTHRNRPPPAPAKSRPPPIHTPSSGDPLLEKLRQKYQSTLDLVLKIHGHKLLCRFPDRNTRQPCGKNMGPRGEARELVQNHINDHLVSFHFTCLQCGHSASSRVKHLRDNHNFTRTIPPEVLNQGVIFQSSEKVFISDLQRTLESCFPVLPKVDRAPGPPPRAPKRHAAEMHSLTRHSPPKMAKAAPKPFFTIQKNSGPASGFGPQRPSLFGVRKLPPRPVPMNSKLDPPVRSEPSISHPPDPVPENHQTASLASAPPPATSTPLKHPASAGYRSPVKSGPIITEITEAEAAALSNSTPPTISTPSSTLPPSSTPSSTLPPSSTPSSAPPPSSRPPSSLPPSSLPPSSLPPSSLPPTSAPAPKGEKSTAPTLEDLLRRSISQPSVPAPNTSTPVKQTPVEVDQSVGEKTMPVETSLPPVSVQEPVQSQALVAC